ncbi:hypothetical protein JVT61DRAFT_10750 [Boletus reticuloceps]|nr:hypothetical protein JVT61DRAFT_10750 [Boletus reticuloceps]
MSKSSLRRTRRKRQKLFKDKEKADLEKIYHQGISDGMNKILESLYNGDNVHLHYVFKHPKLLVHLKAAEVRNRQPLCSDDPEIINANPKWLFQPGIHLCIDQESDEVVFAVRISPWDQMSQKQKSHTQATLTILMDCATAVPSITTNSAQQGTKGLHGDGIRFTKPYGIMKAVGWHHSFEKNKSIATYAPLPTPAALTVYKNVMPKLPQVAGMYRDRLCTLLPHAGRKMVEESEELGIPSFAMLSLDASTTPQQPFANSLTLTYDDFANSLHQDNDFHAIAYGMWWASSSAGSQGPFSFEDAIDHDSIKGGHFFNGEFNIGVDFSRCQGLVEIFWRGKLDHHCTMKSTSAQGTTRWGTSVQITQKGVNAIAAFRNKEDPTRSIDYYKRVANLAKKLDVICKKRKAMDEVEGQEE